VQNPICDPEVTELTTGHTGNLTTRAGLGRYKQCSCWAFKGSGSICGECEHRYEDHATSPL
jgi:hypothetical protein